MASRKVYAREIASLDGLITDVVATDLGNTVTRYTYFDLARVGYNAFTLEHIITATTLTFEGCNSNVLPGQLIKGVATSTTADGTTIIDSALSTAYAADTDLIGLQVRVVSDSTTVANVGLTRTIVTYATSTGTMTLSSALGAVTSGVTKYQLEDNPSEFQRLVNDPTGAQWRDITTLLTGSSSQTASGTTIVDLPVFFERIRIKRVTSNATNALKLRLTRGRA